jgi:hypothetical protein
LITLRRILGRQVVRMLVVCWQTNCTNVPPAGLLGSLPMHKSGPRYKLLPAPCLRVAGLLSYHLQCLPLSAGWGPLPGGASPATRTQNVTSSWPCLFVCWTFCDSRDVGVT